jgi:tetratricopeptide (TPR) repeat protein
MERCQTALGENTSEAANAIRALMYIHTAAIYYQQSALDRAEEKCQSGLSLIGAQKQPKIYAEGCNLLGAIKLRTGNLAVAQKEFEQSLSLWKQVGDQYQVKRVGDNLRATLRRLGDLAQMRKIEDEILQYWEKFPNNIHFAMALTNHGQTLGNDGEYKAAIELQQRAMSISDLLGVQRIRALVRVNLAWSLIALGKYDEAEGYIKESLVIQTEFKTTESWVEAQRGLAAVALGRKLGGQAVELAQIALQLAREEHDRLEEGAILRVLGQAYQLNGDLVQSREHLENSLTLLRENGYKYESLLTLQALGKLYEALGDAKARSVADEARSLAAEMGLNLPD